VPSKGEASPSSQRGLRNPVAIGLISAVLAAAAYGTTQTLARHLVTGAAPPQVGATYTILFGMLILAAMSARNWRQDLKAPRAAMAWMAAAGTASSFGVLFMFTALSQVPVTLASPIGAVNPLIAIALTHIFLQRLERVTPRMIFGAILVVVGVTLVVIGRVG
ncbi:MAG: DMT family transporter, partial [Chloroflexi bacterium]|nr:DMT family transporter [Chloroflexota bacterium]